MGRGGPEWQGQAWGGRAPEGVGAWGSHLGFSLPSHFLEGGPGSEYLETHARGREAGSSLGRAGPREPRGWGGRTLSLRWLLEKGAQAWSHCRSACRAWGWRLDGTWLGPLPPVLTPFTSSGFGFFLVLT